MPLPVRVIVAALRFIGFLDALKRVLGRPWLARLAGRFIRLRDIGGGSGAGRVTVLVFSSFRWLQDIEVLARQPDMRLIEMNAHFVHLVNSLFKVAGVAENRDYHKEENPRVLAARERLRRFVGVFVNELKRHYGIQVALTAAMHYTSEQEWAQACHDNNLPFVAAHKEFTIIDGRHLGIRIERYRQAGTRFKGSALLVTNTLAKQLMNEGGVFPAERTHLAGLMRMDRLFNGEFPLRSPETPLLTLFSFGHLSGGVSTDKRRSHYFSADGTGFIRMFEETHALVAQLALRRPDIQVAIKLKNHSDWWIREIDAVIKAATGMSSSEIPNLAYVTEQAPSLIARSTLVVGFNSTVVLETLALRQALVVPRFAEAAGPLADNVYFSNYDDVIHFAPTWDDMVRMVEDGLANPDRYKPKNETRLNEMLESYFGNFDGSSARRVAAHLVREAQAAAERGR